MAQWSGHLDDSFFLKVRARLGHLVNRIDRIVAQADGDIKIKNENLVQGSNLMGEIKRKYK